MQTEQEQAILQAIRELGDEAYGVALQRKVAIPFGKLYVALERMEERRLVTSRDEPGGAEHSFRPKRVWRVRE